MRKNHKGFTLVELIIAVAILAIVTLAVCGFIVVGSRSYTSANTDIMLQQEAQLALNQISDVIIDTTDSINYGNGTELVLKDSEFSDEPDEKILVVVNKKGSNNDNDSYRFEWSKDTETIYFNTSSTVIDDAHQEPVFDAANRSILAQHVKELHIDISQFEENRVVMISMTFENGNREYTTSNNVTVRNRIALNKIDIDPMKKAEDFTITTVRNVTLEPGDTFNLKDKTQVNTTSDDDAVVWEMVDGGTTSTVSADGQLSIGTDETRQSFLVRVRRVNEEYANQNDKVAKTVKVNIKRVNSVDLSCSAVTIKAGDTITVSGIASGYMLGGNCEAHSCFSDDESKDYDLVPTRWRIVRGPASIDTATSDERKTEVKISSTAKAGDEIEIEATSDLSTRKSYGTVTGTLILKVTEGATGGIPLRSGFKFGTDNDEENGMTLDYMYEGILPNYNYYIVCVRVRELDATSAENDQVIVYDSNVGKNPRFFPDMFGLELNRSYNVYMQLLLPVPADTIQANGGNALQQYEDSESQIVTEYKGHVDPVTGEYTGDRYLATPLYYGLITPPILSLQLNGVTYPNNGNYFETYSFPANGQTVMGKISWGSLLNIKYQTFESYNSVKFTVYKGEGNNINDWTRVCGYNEDTGEYDSTSFPNGAISMNPYGNVTGDPFLKRDINNYDLSGTVGTYHIVPGYEYANDPNIGNYRYLLKENIHGDYDMHYYTQPDCTIHLKITGFNMELPPENGQEQWTFFPVPADRDFPFALESSEDQEITRYFGIYSASGNKIKDLWNVTVKCSYLPGVGGSEDAYRIELSSKETRGKVTIYNNYGTYKCTAGGDEWSIVTPGTTREESHWKARIYFKFGWGTDGMMEVPLPSDADFPKFTGSSHTVSGNMTLYVASDEYGEGGWSDSVTLEYSYDAATEMYQVEVQYGTSLGRWECTKTGKEWKKVN